MSDVAVKLSNIEFVCFIWMFLKQNWFDKYQCAIPLSIPVDYITGLWQVCDRFILLYGHSSIVYVEVLESITLIRWLTGLLNCWLIHVRMHKHTHTCARSHTYKQFLSIYPLSLCSLSMPNSVHTCICIIS